MEKSGWMPTNLPWVEPFWEKLQPKRIMRLNPHWHIESEENGSFLVEDIFLEKKFRVRPAVTFEPGLWKATFNGLGLTIMARSQLGGANSALRYVFDPPETSSIDVEAMDKLMYYWLASIREYSRLYAGKGVKLWFWRGFMNKVVLTMNPTQRRICLFMLKFTVIEIILIISLVIGYFLFLRGG